MQRSPRCQDGSLLDFDAPVLIELDAAAYFDPTGFTS